MQYPGLVPQRSDDDVGPESRTVFSNAQTLVRITAFLTGDFEFPVRPLALDSFLRIKPGEVLADNFLRLIALDSFRALVPGRNSSLRV